MISAWYSSEIYTGQAQNIEHVVKSIHTPAVTVTVSAA